MAEYWKVTHRHRPYNIIPVAFYVTLEGKIPRTPYWHGDVYSALGALSPSREFSEKFKKYPSFQNNKIRYYNSHIARLYWNGYFEEALLNFNLLNTAQKVNLTLNQAKFVVPCKMCTI